MTLCDTNVTLANCLVPARHPTVLDQTRGSPRKVPDRLALGLSPAWNHRQSMSGLGAS